MASSTFKVGDRIVTTDTVSSRLYEVGARGVVQDFVLHPIGGGGVLDCLWHKVLFDNGRDYNVPAVFLRKVDGLLDI